MASPGDRIGIIGGARLPNEDAYAWSKLARTVLHTDNVDAQLGDGLPAELVAGLPRATIDQVCDAPLIVIVAPDLKEELPVLYLRLRHAAVEKGVPIIEISSAPTGLSSRARQSLRYRPGELATLVRALCSGTPVTTAVAGVGAEDVERARAAIAAASAVASTTVGTGTPGVAVVIGRPSLAEASSGAAEAASLLAQLPGVAFLPALRRSNVHGAIDFGLAPGLLPGRVGLDEGRTWYERHWGASLPVEAGLDTAGMLTRAAAGSMDVIFLVGADPLADCPDKGLAALALETARFVVAIDAFATESIAYADIVLPAAVYTERRGSFTNIEGRITWLGQKVTAPGTARPDWMIALELATRLGPGLGVSSLEELWAEIETVSPLHAGATTALLMSRQGRNGIVVPVGPVAPGVGAPGGTEAPAPLDPMADPGIASAEIHPPPPVPFSVADTGVSPTAAPGVSPAAVPGGSPGGAPSAVPARLQRRPPAAATTGSAALTAAAEASVTTSVRLVASRPMWDGGVLVQRSPSLAALHPALALALNPADLDRLGLGAAPGGRVRVSTGRGTMEVGTVANAAVPPGTAVLPFNLPEGGAGTLIDVSAPYTELTVEPVGGP